MNKKTSVKCTGSMLTAGFHNANPPLIWRFDLERNHSFTIALQGEDGDWELGVTSAKGDFYPIAHFPAREDAEEAFIKIEKILSRKRGPFSYILKALLIVASLAALLILAIMLFFKYIEHSAMHAASMMGAANMRAVPPALMMPKQEGVPQSADDILQPPKP